MEISHVVLLVISASISFALGRTIVYFRNKKKNAEAQKRADMAMLNVLPSPVSKNKSKRKRQARFGQP